MCIAIACTLMSAGIHYNAQIFNTFVVAADDLLAAAPKNKIICDDDGSGCIEPVFVFSIQMVDFVVVVVDGWICIRSNAR